ncbi:MAG: Eco47II family restriction endonuclease [Candidatus Margulisiibacteriota bacterium]
MSSHKYLDFIKDEDLINHVEAVLQIAQSAFNHAEDELYSNTIDPFSAVFDVLRQGITLKAWLQQEKSRQIQKTLQNALGIFHQNLIGSIPGWSSLPVGNLIDVVNQKKQIIAEIKNKYNTTKGSDRKSIYDNLTSALKAEYKGFTGYYVEIIPSTLKPYDKPFTPSDNVTKRRRRPNKMIRVIDGKSFYSIATGKPNALREIYYALPEVISVILGGNASQIKKDSLFEELYSQAYA